MALPVLHITALLRCVFSRGRTEADMVFAVWSTVAVHADDALLVAMCVLVTVASYIDKRTLGPLGLTAAAVNSIRHYADGHPHDGDLFLAGSAAVCLPAAIAAFWSRQNT